MWRRICSVLLALLLLGPGGSAMAAEAVPTDGIYINLASCMLYLYSKGKVVIQAPIGAGKVATPSPRGSYRLVEKDEYPVWVDPEDPKKVVEGGWGNPLGLRWMRFEGNYGIHGTNNPGSIGWYVSNGCIRMYEEDVEEVYDRVELGCPVVLVYERLEFEKQADGLYGYRIHPDEYKLQPLTVKDVQRELLKLGLQSATSPKEIAEKLEASDGELSLLRRVYKVEIDGRWISGRALELNGVLYLPVMPVSNALKLPYKWVRATEELTTALGTDVSISYNDELLMTQECAEKVFGVKGAFNEKEVFCLLTEKRQQELAEETAREAAAQAEAEALALQQAYGPEAPAATEEPAGPSVSPAAVKQGKE